MKQIEKGNAMSCKECDDKGYVMDEVTTGGTADGSPWQSYRSRRVPCEVCAEFQFHDPDGLSKWVP